MPGMVLLAAASKGGKMPHLQNTKTESVKAIHEFIIAMLVIVLVVAVARKTGHIHANFPWDVQPSLVPEQANQIPYQGTYLRPSNYSSSLSHYPVHIVGGM